MEDILATIYQTINGDMSQCQAQPTNDRIETQVATENASEKSPCQAQPTYDHAETQVATENASEKSPCPTESMFTTLAIKHSVNTFADMMFNIRRPSIDCMHPVINGIQMNTPSKSKDGNTQVQTKPYKHRKLRMNVSVVNVGIPTIISPAARHLMGVDTNAPEWQAINYPKVLSSNGPMNDIGYMRYFLILDKPIIVSRVGTSVCVAGR